MMQLKKIFLVLFFVSLYVIGNSQDDSFISAYEKIEKTLSGTKNMSFKEAIYEVENAYLHDKLNFTEFNERIIGLRHLVEEKNDVINIDYDMSDKEQVKLFAALFSIMKDTTEITINDKAFFFFPFTYDFNDFFGEKDWTNMFVSKLLATKKGNCHSLPYLYKILADEVGAETYLALAPNHTYIKHLCQKTGWYNTELTSGAFPQDAWLKASGYIPLIALQNGIYLRALSEKESIALCMVDLAMGYNQQCSGNDGAFVIQCCDAVLAHFPKFIKALLLKSETITRLWTQERDKESVAAKAYWSQMQDLYRTIHELGYRQMPKKMYVDWLQSIEEVKYQNQDVPQIRK